eukprot:CAMPEP_0196231770 /NCGR_PEP_ID=MMETSP0913-20130531/2486_1 /TAXON_ID=49265 /ORGANISM="Thalassiosira rotula, Strain GSO102" /LENGTH=121 /DNA_ID=CAMNT_0041512023 /DNA_START=189 /DNA_END=550 /DNA_ORIENTATION=+
MKQSLTSSFVGYENAVRASQILTTYISDGGEISECAADAYLEVHGDDDVVGGGGRSSLKTIRLPGNVLETRGLGVAREVHLYLKEGRAEEGLPLFMDNQSNALVRQKQKLCKLRNVLPESF